MILHNSKYFVATASLLKPLSVILASLGTFYTLFFSTIFQISNTECVQDVGELCQNEFVLAELESYLGQNLFLLDDASVLKRLQAGDPTIRTSTLTKSLPGTLKLELQSAYPVLALATPGSERILVLSDQFYVIKAMTTDPHVPLVVYDQELSLRLGQQIVDPQLTKLLQASVAISQAFPPSQLITLRGDTLELRLDGKYKVLFTTTVDLSTQIAALRSLLNNATIPPSTAQIDLRYSQPVLQDKSSL